MVSTFVRRGGTVADMEGSTSGRLIMNRMLKTTIAAALAVTAASVATPAGAVDFSCRDARTAAERAICADATLGRLDDRMATLYGRVWSVASTRARLDLKAYQHRFLQARDSCGRNSGCIRGAYLDQVSVLDQRLADLRGE
jgi:uncharacterized protein